MKRRFLPFIMVLALFAVSCSQSSSDDEKADAVLSGLTLSSGTLTPAFSGAQTAYTASVTNAVAAVTVTPTVASAGLTVTVSGTVVIPGAGSGSVALTEGDSTSIPVVVSNGASSTTYTVAVTRAGIPAIQVSGDLLYNDNNPFVYESGTTSVDFSHVSTTGNFNEITMTITNIGTADLTLSGSSPFMTITGLNFDHFTISVPPSEAVVPKSTGKTFTVRMTMLGTGYGDKTATLTIPSDDPDGDFVLTLTGSTC